MTGAAAKLLVVAVAVSAIACGSRSGSHPVSQGGTPSTGAAAPSSSASGDPDAPGQEPGQVEPGQGEPGGPARECEALVARVNGCPGLADDVKQAFARSAALWAEEAKASGENRAAADADCRETATSMRQQLGDLGC
jgi:hypothetical protein